MQNTFKIIFVKGIDYQANNTKDLQSYKSIIYNSFCLLSWLIPDYQVRILNQMVIDQTAKIKLFKKESQKQKEQFYMVQKKVDNFIFYQICPFEVYSQAAFRERSMQIGGLNWGIKAQFINNDDLNKFTIKIDCKAQVKAGLTFHSIFSVKKIENPKSFYNYFKPPSLKPTQQIKSLLDVEYYYIEPENRRYFKPQGHHLSLAFQGGGTKGVSYVGVKKAIQNLQERIRKESSGQIQLPITSVIGSSAGGILSLAISAGIKHQDLIDLCYMMDTLIQDRFIPHQIQGQSQIEQSIQSSYFQDQSTGVKHLLHNLGLVQDSLSELIFETLKQPSVQQKIIALLKQINPSVASLLSFQQPYSLGQGETINNCIGSCFCCCYSKCSSCFVQKSTQYRKLNIYGLLYAALMTGDAVQNILAYALSLFLQIQAHNKSGKLTQLAKKKSWFNSNNTEEIFYLIIKNAKEIRSNYRAKSNNTDQSYLKNILIDYSKTLTLKQYYDLNGVEFTCTSVDLHDKIERFFNHKTTPHLPICKAVQMTGSFPVAFLSLQWKQQWGKYYIHYGKTRRQINLEGHHFTDGGLLANFPLKFLDNQKFRPKYFSHQKVEGKTLLYGFGLDQLDNFPEQNNSQSVGECMSQLMQQIKYRIMYKFMVYLMKCGGKQTLEIKNVKLFQFLFSLLDALRESDRNLNQECFKSEIIQTTLYKRSIKNVQELRIIKKPIASFLHQIANSINAHFLKTKNQLLRDQFNSIYNKYSQFEDAYEKKRQIDRQFNNNLSWEKIQQIKSKIQNNILAYSRTDIQMYHQTIVQLKDKYQNKDHFMTSGTDYHEHQILLLLYRLKKSMMELKEQQFSLIKQKMHQNCQQYYSQIRKIYQAILNTEEVQSTVNNIQKQPFINQSQVNDLLNMKYKLSPFVFNLFDRINQLPQFKHLTPILNYQIQQDVYLNTTKIRKSIRNEVELKEKEYALAKNPPNKQNPARLHVILEASYFSQYYFSNYIKIVEEAISDKGIKIDIITCTNYHAIFGVLYALGYENVAIKREMYKIKYMFEENTKIAQVYHQKQWMKSNIEQIKNLLQREWQKQANPFQMAELQPMNNFNHLANRLQFEKEEISGAFEKVIDYLSASYLQMSHLPKQKRKDRFDQLLNLGKYKKINETASENGQRIIEHFLDYTINLLMNVAEYIFKNDFSLFTSKKWNQQTLFKGMIISSLLNTLKYRMKIYQILIKADLERNITLSNFYEVCDKKILLNFNCINTTQQRFGLVNKITKPNMPVWAALMACASLPYLSGQFGSYREWQNKEKEDRKMDIADRVFKQFENDRSNGGSMNNFISSNLISTLPLQIMTNQKLINERLSQTQNTHVIQIAFGFDSQFQDDQNQVMLNKKPNLQQNNIEQTKNFFSEIPAKMQGKRKFINCIDMISCMCQYICCCCCNLSGVGGYFADLMERLQTLKMLNIRINSHDNLILNIYYDTLIKLPLRIGTLDFYKINKNRPDLDDTILQAQKVVEQLCDTIYVSPKDNRQIVYRASQRATIQVSHHLCDIFDKDQNAWKRQQLFYRVKFISYTKWRDFNSKYFIQYSLNTTQNNIKKIDWLKVKQDYIDFNQKEFAQRQYQLLLKFTYYKNRLISKIYLLSMKAVQKIELNRGRAIFSMNYRQSHFCQQQIKAINQGGINEKIRIRSSFLPKSSKYCSNPECFAIMLQYVLIYEKRSVCFTCQMSSQLQGCAYNKVALVAMRCPKCISNYCLQCKVSQFIQKKKNSDISDDFYYECPKNSEINMQNQIYAFNYTPIIYRFQGGEFIKKSESTCCFCQKFCERLLFEKDIKEGTKPLSYFSGLRICQSCLYIAN